MTAPVMYLVIGLPGVALLFALGALLLTKKTHDRFREALLAEESEASAIR